MKSCRIIVLFLGILIFTGCGTTTFYEANRQIDSARLSELKIGITTPAEAIKLLGVPLLFDETHDGRSQLMYSAEEKQIACLAFDKKKRLYNIVVYKPKQGVAEEVSK